MNFQPLLEKLRTWWETSDRTQKIISIAGAALLVALVAGAVWVASRPKMEPIFPGASPTEQGAVRDAVVGYGFPAEINARGDVMVPTDKIPEIKIRLSQDGKLPASAALAMPESSGQNPLFQTPLQQDQEMKAKKETELAKSIMTLSGVRAARVHVNFGKDSPFGDQKSPPTAVINITEQPGTSLTQSQSEAIARLVQNSITGLQSKDVSVINSMGRILYDGEELNSEDALATRKLEAEREESRRREKEIQEKLDAAFGPMATLAQVTVELNMDDVEVEETKRSPSQAPEARDTVSEELEGGAAAPRGPAGTDANPPAQPATAPNRDNAGAYKSETSSERFATNVSHTRTKKAAGSLESLNVAVLVDTTKVQNLQAVQQFVDGLLATKGDRNFTSAVVPTTFSSAAQDSQKKLSEQAASEERIKQIISLLPIAVLLIVAFLLLRALTKSSQPAAAPESAAAAEALPGEAMAALPDGRSESALPEPVGEGDMTRLLEASQDESYLSETEPEYDLSALDDIDLSQFTMQTPTEGDPGGAAMEHDLKRKMMMFEETDEESPIHVKEIREKVDIPLERIRLLAKERPETVAMLLKSWLMEEH